MDTGGENIIGAPKMKNNFRFNIKMSIFSITSYLQSVALLTLQ